ncbi:hypothetical protein A9179_00985 [Pseudomonas alcaligenes]|uniref:Uncharacterized protein n=1 Tax=Aquipseudomonas alcaligenes TaxID=43263 RepID=A0ABR7RVR2_AQUAC|nr:hypothetical protein [Pseudomonas alcaligenes]MBC9248839.1 hypothetical protein [Pseudomonas alcaligenes]
MRVNLLLTAIFAAFPLFFSQLSLAETSQSMSDFQAALQARQHQAAEQTAKADAAEAKQAQAGQDETARDS